MSTVSTQPQSELAESPAEHRLAAYARTILLTGSTALILVLVGPLIVFVLYGLTPYERLLSGFLSPQTLFLFVGGAIVGLMAIVSGYSSFRRMPTKTSRERAIAGAVLGLQAVGVAAVGLAFREFGEPDPFFRNFLNFAVIDTWDVFINAAKNTLILAFVGETGGIVLGLTLATLVLSKRAVVRAPARVYINFFRGTPLIWQLSFIYFLFSLGLGLRFDTFTVAMIVFSLNTGAYAAEVFRAGIQSIERGQIEAARSLGMSYPQAMWNAIIPQAFRRVIPPLMNEFVILIKDTALVIVLGLFAENYEIYTTAREGYSATGNATWYVVAAAAYLIVTLPLIRAVNAVEKRLRSGLVTVTS